MNAVIAQISIWISHLRPSCVDAPLTPTIEHRRNIISRTSSFEGNAQGTTRCYWVSYKDNDGVDSDSDEEDNALDRTTMGERKDRDGEEENGK